MNRFLEEALALKDELIQNRRYLHQNAELAFDLPLTKAFVTEMLESYGYQVSELGGGLTAACGNGSPVIMLRADMDALPLKEESGLPYACTSGEACHACGHDAHTAMLLCAARILKNHESELKGTVKFMFQAGEETLKGSQAMIDAGILENPHVDAAMGLHLNFGPCGPYDIHPGTIAYAKGPMLASADEFEITVTGKTAHGSMAYLGVSAVSVASNIVAALQQMVALEVPAAETVALSIGSLYSGSASNILPGDATISGSFRTLNPVIRENIRKRVVEISQGIASAWRASADVNYKIGIDPNVNDRELTEEMGSYIAEVAEKVEIIEPVLGSEDFANLCRHVPTFFANVCAGDPSDGYEYAMHNPKMRIDEDALVYGAAAHCNCAVSWLANHSR